MCLIIFDWQPTSQRPLTLAANRDEFHARASLDADFWEDKPEIFAGRDLEKDGTWLGVAKNIDNPKYRLSALTNFRSPDSRAYTHSRGEITEQFLSSNLSAIEFAKSITYSLYAGFNALFFDGAALVYYHHEPNKAPEFYAIDEGVYGLSNAKLNTPWPKVEKTKLAFQSLTQHDAHVLSANHLFSFLRDDQAAGDEQLPNTGVGIALERMLSPAFIISPSYGTRTSTVVIIESQESLQSVYFHERQFTKKGEMRREQIKAFN